MKKILTIAILFAATLTSYSQALGYQDLGLLFSQDDKNGSARFTAMSGAFGALGGDVSVMNINPAGIAFFNNSSFSGTVNSRSTDIFATYGNPNFMRNTMGSQNEFINLSHAGAVLVFDSSYSSDWSKFAIGFNYRITKDFTNSFSAQGNSGTATFIEFPLDTNDPAIAYNIADEQRFINNYGGEISEFNIAFSSVHQNKLYLGLGLNFYDLNFSQQAQLIEFNSDTNGNALDVDLYQDNFTTGTGFSANAGFIYKAHKNFRFGVSYQTPTWFTEIIQDVNYFFDNNNNVDNTFANGDVDYFIQNDSYSERTQFAINSYRLKTPSKLTASAAFIFGKSGLLSFDYINRNYQNMRLSNGIFTQQNQFFQNELRNTHSYNVGTEWRLDRFSIRGGYRFEQSPDKNAAESDNLTGHSFGAGYNFGSFKLDFSYSNNNQTGVYNFYPGFNVNPAELQIDNRTITATITLNL